MLPSTKAPKEPPHVVAKEFRSLRILPYRNKNIAKP